MDAAPRTGTEQHKARMEEMRRAQRVRERRNRWLTMAAGTVVVAGLVTGGVVLLNSGSSDAAPAAASDGKGGEKGGGEGRFVTRADGVRTWKGTLDRNHTTTPVTYPMEPPVGGDHNPVWQNCNGDVYSEPVKNEAAVHALEHGAVWVTYNSKASKADVAALAAKVRKTPYTLMSPVEDQKDPLMLSAWAHQRSVTGANDPHVDKFLSEFVQGPQTPEPGATCTGGLDR
ncbi:MULTISPECIES: DUF3105 domain-containing protein [unclassified Streptomyces]|uniref:DUF3105 domain-containing protein n=1 Tax=unclassified Streptomyces TaxID=2593676 RepID=UPI0037F344A2